MLKSVEISNNIRGKKRPFSVTSGSCGGSYTDVSGHISSPSYPNAYPALRECFYTISRPAGTVILLNFLSMDIPGTKDNCNKETSDKLEVRDGPLATSPLLQRLCGYENPPNPIKSKQNKLWMK